MNKLMLLVVLLPSCLGPRSGWAAAGGRHSAEAGVTFALKDDLECEASGLSRSTTQTTSHLHAAAEGLRPGAPACGSSSVEQAQLDARVGLRCNIGVFHLGGGVSVLERPYGRLGLEVPVGPHARLGLECVEDRGEAVMATISWRL